MAALDLDKLLYWTGVPAPRFVGGNRVRLLQGGDALFPSMLAAIEGAAREVWLATYIFHDDPGAVAIMRALAAAARRGVAVHVVVDGFGAFVGGINVIDDRFDLHHGWGERPRLDFAVELQGPLAADVQRVAQALWTRANLSRGWREELAILARSAEPVARTMQLLREMRTSVPEAATGAGDPPLPPVRAALIVRDNLRQRRAIERSYIEAIRRARERIDIACPYFYPGRGEGADGGGAADVRGGGADARRGGVPAFRQVHHAGTGAAREGREGGARGRRGRGAVRRRASSGGDRIFYVFPS